MATYCITFPMYHPLRDDWIEITAASMREARHAAFTLFGRRYGSVYDLVDFLAFGSFVRAHLRGGRVGNVIAASDIEPREPPAGDQDYVLDGEPPVAGSGPVTPLVECKPHAAEIAQVNENARESA